MGQFLMIGVVGLAIFLIGLFLVRKSQAAGSWPSTTGTIIQTAIEQRDSGDPESASLGLVVGYRFQIAGRNYSGSRIRFDETMYSTTKQAQAALSRFPVGGQLPVYYDPQNPENCTLQKSNRSGWILLTIGAVIMLASIVAILA
jgi:hypothetical protein